MAQQKKKLVSVNTRLPQNLLAQLRSYVTDGGHKTQTVIAEAVRLYLVKKKEIAK